MIFSQSILFSFKEDCISGETKMDASKTSRHPALGFPCFSAIVLAFFNANLASALKRTIYLLQYIMNEFLILYSNVQDEVRM